MDKLKPHTLTPAVSNSEKYADTVKALQEDVHSYASCSHHDSSQIVISHFRKFVGEVGRTTMDISPLCTKWMSTDCPQLGNGVYKLYGEKYGYDNPDYSEILAYKCATVEDVAVHIDRALKVNREKTMTVVENFNHCDNERKIKAIFALIDMTVKDLKNKRNKAVQSSTVQEDANKNMDEAIAAIEEE